MHCTWCTPCLVGVAFVPIAIGKMEILATFPHFQDEKELIRRYEGWYYTNLVYYYNILYFETDWSRIRPLRSTELENGNVAHIE